MEVVACRTSKINTVFTAAVAVLVPNIFMANTSVKKQMQAQQCGSLGVQGFKINTIFTAAIRGGQTFPKSTEIRNSVAFRAFFSVFFHPCFSVVAESVSEQLLPRTGGLGGQFWLSKESVSTSATDCRIPAPICTKYGLQKSVHVELMDCTLYIKSLANTYIRFKRFLMGRLWPPKQAVVRKRNKTGGCLGWGRAEGGATAWRDVPVRPQRI